MSEDFCICICTYMRSNLLRDLLLDLEKQTLQPKQIIIVDGEPQSPSVIKELTHLSLNKYTSFEYIYIPSNHSNIAYHRYLGWKFSSTSKNDIIVYIDDDIRIFQESALEILILPLLKQDNDVVGISGKLIFGNETHKIETNKISKNKSTKVSDLINLFAKKKYEPGTLSPIGNRIHPLDFSNEGYGNVNWASGGVMAFDIKALGNNCFTEDSFALHNIGLGLGDDTIISHSISQFGGLLLANNAIFHHPSIDASKAVPSNPFKRGYAIAYSRRLINDKFRIIVSPRFSDRYALVKSYIGNNLINFANAILHPKTHRFGYAGGYFVGSVRGLFQKPTAHNLTPEIDWWQDAEEALAQAITIH